ncbi:MAG: SecE/Sec61-gamma subunit of protein translocation complex [Verrucomicrobia bacterium]|nr:SecE/Sec61-gamma subunit of protein translocation complex [Verrucomicrobiota bacterium]
MKEYLPTIIGLVLLVALIGVLWSKGYLLRFGAYVGETQEELRKCSWPTVEELKGSTLVVLVSIVLLGGFTVIIDFIVSSLVKVVMTM